MWWQYIYWRQGIPAKVFREESITDIHNIIEIHNAINSKGARETKIKQMIAKIGMK